MLIALALVLAACGAETADPSVTIDGATWDGATITIEADTNLPDGAVLSWYVVEGDNWDDLDAADVSGFEPVADSRISVSVEVAGFSTDQALVDVAFVPRYDGQPADVADAYEPNQGANDETTVTR